ncbi:MAG: hypothetical protein WC683_04605 [bacterium]
MAQKFILDESAFVAPQVFPTVGVKKLSDRILQYPREAFFRDDARPRAPGKESQGGGFTVNTEETYSCREWAWHIDIPDELRDNADVPINLDRDGTEFVTQVLRIRRDLWWAQNFFATGLWTTEYLGVAGAPAAGQVRIWSDYVNSTPIQDIEAAKIAVWTMTGFQPNVLVLGKNAWRYLKHHPTLVARYQYVQAVPVLTEPMVASIFGLDKVVVGRAVYTNTIERGAPVVYQGILGNHALLAYVQPAPSLMKPSAGYIYNYTGGNRQGLDIIMERYRSPLDEKFDRLVGSFYADMKLLEADLGAFFRNVVV